MLHHEFGRSCYLEWLPRWLSDKGSPCQPGDAGSIPGLGRPPREGNDNPQQDSCLENPWTEEPGGLQSMGSHRSRALKYAQQEEKEIALFHSFSLLKEILIFLLGLLILNVTKHVKCSAPCLSVYSKCSISLNFFYFFIFFHLFLLVGGQLLYN